MKMLFNKKISNGPSLRAKRSNPLKDCFGRDRSLAMTRLKRGQSIAEYVAVIAVVLTAIFATGIIDRLRNSFDRYCDTAIERLR